MNHDTSLGPPAKRPRLGEASSRPQRGHVPMQSSHPGQSVQSIGHITSSSTQQALANLAAHDVPATVCSNNSDLIFPGFGEQWTSGHQPSSGQRMAPHSGCCPSHTISAMCRQNYPDHVQLTYLEQSNIIMQPQLPMFPAFLLPHVLGQLPSNLSGQSTPVPTSLPNQDLLPNTLDSMDHLMSVPDEHRIEKDTEPEDPEDVENQTVCFGMVSP